MKMLPIKKTLQSYGLTANETNLYLAALQLGESAMTPLAEKAKLKRPTAYKTYASLHDKGLMGSFKMRTSMRYVATKPQVLVARLHQNMHAIEGILPQLHSLQESKKFNAPKIRHFTGVQGYKNAIEDSLTKPNITLRHIGSLHEIHKIKTKDYDLNYYMPKRIENNIFLRSLYFTNTAAEVTNVDQHKYLRDIRYLPNQYYFKGATLIYENKVIMTTGAEELTTIMIESADIATAERQKFDLIWNMSNNKIRPKSSAQPALSVRQ